MAFKKSFRNRIIGTLPFAFDFIESAKLFRQSYLWRRRGFPLPLPSLIKRAMLLTESLRFRATTFVETGTHVGDTIWFLRNHFKEIHSIEVYPPLHEAAKNRFAKFPHIHLYLGDSADVLSQMCASLNGRVLFWLDGHYSGTGTGKGTKDTPIQRELEIILNECRAEWLIFIDDARLFGTDPSYPTIEDLIATKILKERNLEVSVSNDMIRVVSRDYLYGSESKRD